MRPLFLALVLLFACDSGFGAERDRKPKPDPTLTFSQMLDPIKPMPSVEGKTIDELLAATMRPGDQVAEEILAKRREILALFQSLGLDLAADPNATHSNTWRNAAPKRWSPETPEPLSGEYRMPFSIDAPFYHRIPKVWPRVELPRGYVKSHQLNTVKGWDGCGLGIIISDASAPLRTVFGNVGGHSKSLEWRIRDRWLEDQLPDNANADRNMHFIDATTNRAVMLWHPNHHANGKDVESRFTPGPYALGTLGDTGGVHASGNTSLGMLIRPGEATNPDQPIRHALAGCTQRMWKARVWPAWMGDAWLYAGGNAARIDGLVPYGGVVQLDPELDLSALKDLSLPARRILEAIQTYGWYNIDTGGPDLDVFTATNAKEWEPWGGVYQGPNGNGVQNQVQRVLTQHRLYLVAPLCRSERIEAWVRANDAKAIAEQKKSERDAERAKAAEERRAARSATTTVSTLTSERRVEADAQLFQRLLAARKAGITPQFTSDLLKGVVQIRHVEPDGQLTLGAQGGELAWTYARLTRGDLCALAIDLARDDIGHALAALYCIDQGRSAEAKQHLLKAGTHAATVPEVAEATKN